MTDPKVMPTVPGPAERQRMDDADRLKRRSWALAERLLTLPAEEQISHESLEATLHLLRKFRQWTIADIVERHYLGPAR